MLKRIGRVLSALFFLSVVIATFYGLRITAPTSTSEVAVVDSIRDGAPVPGGRGPAAAIGPLRMEFHEPCRDDSECSGSLLCLSGRCDKLDLHNRGHVDDVCSGPTAGPFECISGSCVGGFCAPTLREKADNGAACNEAAARVCRSGICRQGQCAPSATFLGLPGADCATDADCLSGRCDERGGARKTCGYSGLFASSCRPLGRRAEFAAECCSGVIDGNSICSPTSDPKCTNFGDCASKVGRVCADIGYPVLNGLLCCSGRAQGGRCVIDLKREFQPCSMDRGCRSGHCDRKTNLCEERQHFNSQPNDMRAPYGKGPSKSSASH